MKVFVIGAGMGGLCAAIALRNNGHDVTVYEKVTEFRPAGAAISVWSNGVKCLNYLGLTEQAAALGGPMHRMAYIDGSTGETMCGFSLAPLVQQVGQAPYPMSRTALQAMLRREFGEDRIHLGQKLVGVEDDGAVVTAHFEGGGTDSGDLLVGADGAHSTVREYVRGGPTPRRYAGYVNWNGLVDIDDQIAPGDQGTTFVGEGKRVSLMPVADGQFYFFFDVPLPPGLPENRETLRDDLRRYFTGWAEPVRRLIEALDPARTNRVEIHDIEPFHTWVSGRVALLGDAAH